MSEPDPPTLDALEQAILGQSPGLTSDDVAARAGVTIAEARRLWRALGFPDARDEAAFTQADLDALSTVAALVGGGLVDFDTAVQLTRAMGQTMSRLADWEVATLAGRVEALEAGAEATGSRVGSAMRLLDQVGGPFEELLIYAWRRHLAAAVGRVETMSDQDDDLTLAEVTVGFADIVGFTALSNQVSQDRIGDLVEIFEARCHDVVAAGRGRVVKTLGDSVLFLSDDPAGGVDIALQIVELVGKDDRMPDVRLGLATGGVVLRLGDVFGPPVNLAARLTTVARRNRVIIDEDTSKCLPSDRFETRPLPARPLRGFGVLEPITVRRH